jgi:hypothetical protein
MLIKVTRKIPAAAESPFHSTSAKVEMTNMISVSFDGYNMAIKASRLTHDGPQTKPLSVASMCLKLGCSCKTSLHD